MLSRQELGNILEGAIVCFGCSWTAGVGEERQIENWPFELHKIDPDLKIVNLARGGTSIGYSLNLLEELVRYHHFDPKFVFFQVTNPLRLTVRYKSYQPSELMKVEDNYYYSREPSYVMKSTIGTPVESWHEDYFLELDNDEIRHSQLRADVRYATHLLRHWPNLIYSQSVNPTLDQEILFNIFDWIGGEKKYMEQVIDNGMHLNMQTLTKQATYFHKVLNERRS